MTRSNGVPAAASRPFGERAERSFFCRSCKRVHRGLWVPEGWYVVERAAGGGARHLRLGLYCSLPCLEQAAAATLAEGAVAQASDPVGGRADPLRDKARIVERAETLLNHLVQPGYLTGLTWSFTTEGPAHARVFHAVAAGRLSGVPGELTGAGCAGTKAAAKAAAARALLEAAAR